MRPRRRRLRVGRAGRGASADLAPRPRPPAFSRIAIVAGALLIGAAPAACRDDPDRADQPVDTAVLIDQRLSQGDVGRDSMAAADSADSAAVADSAGASNQPIFVLASDSAAGFILYHRRAGCIACHGPDGQGLANLGPSLRDSVWLHIAGTPEEIFGVIRNGIAQPRAAAVPMPGLASRLDAEEIHRVAAFVYSLSHPGAAVADTAAARRDSLLKLADTLGTIRDTRSPSR